MLRSVQPASPIGAVENPAAYLPGDRRRALEAGRDIADRAHGAALFVDISGFTQLTEGLVAEYGPRRGAEQLGATLEVVFAAVLNQLHTHGGSAIYFSGDAVTCWIDGDEGPLAVACAIAMQAALADVRDVVLPSGTLVRLAMKVAVAIGDARRFVVGDPDIQLIDVLAGRLIDDLAEAEGTAHHGEVVITAATRRRVGDLVRVGDERVSASGEPVYAITALVSPGELPPESDPVTRLPEQVCAQWLLPAVYERLRDGNGDFVAELRRTTPLFLRFTGIDYDTDPDAAAKLDEFVVRAQRVVDGLGGNVLQLTIGDKGAYLYATFGSPIAHEDDSARACAAALRLLDLEASTAARQISVGIARGDTRSGTYGHRLRRTFCCLGDPVNLAARLMVAAPPGRAWVGEAAQVGAGDRFEWSALPLLTVKGKADPVVAFALMGERRRDHGQLGAAERSLIGREDVLDSLTAVLDEVRRGRGRVVGITAEAGVGKSRLIAEFAAAAGNCGALVVAAECEAFGGRTPYQAWRELVPALIGWDVDAAVAGQLQHLTTFYDRLDPELTARVPLLGAIGGVELPDNPMTASLDAKLRKESVELLVVQTLTRMLQRTGPLVVIVDDCTGLDPLGADLLEVVARAVVDLPVVLVTAYRVTTPDEAPGWLRTQRGLAHASEVELAELVGTDAEAMLDAVVAELYGPDVVVLPRFRAALLERTNGNPFHVEEMVAFLRARGVAPDTARDDDLAELPETLHSLVLGRIDNLPDNPRRAAKVASVIGRSFDVPAVEGVYPEFGGADAVSASLEVLTARDLILVDDPEIASYLFRHVVVREVAYDSLPFSLRAVLHERMGGYLEAHLDDTDRTADLIELLAHHFWRSGNDERKRRYLQVAGDAARERFANETAIEHYERLLTLLGPDAAEPVLKVLSEVRELVGDWTEAAEGYERVREIASARGDRSALAWASTALAEVRRKQGDFPAAAGLLQDAENEFVVLGDDAGLGRVLHLAGTLAGQQQQIARARDLYERSLVIRRQLGDRSAESGLLANLGIMAEYEGDYATAIELTRQALALRTELGDRWAIGHAQSNLGMLLLYDGQVEAAVDALAAALRAHREVGDRWMIAIDHNNLAAALLRLDDLIGAADNFETCLAAHRLTDDPWSAAHLLEDIAGLAVRSPDPNPAFVLVGAADALRDRINAPRTPTQQADQDALLASLAARLGGAAHELRAHGRGLSAAQAFDVAAEVCSALLRNSQDVANVAHEES